MGEGTRRRGRTRRRQRRGPYWVGWLIHEVLQALGDGHGEDGADIKHPNSPNESYPGTLGFWLDQLERAIEKRNWHAVQVAFLGANVERWKLRDRVRRYKDRADFDDPPEGSEGGQS